MYYETEEEKQIDNASMGASKCEVDHINENMSFLLARDAVTFLKPSL